MKRKVVFLIIILIGLFSLTGCFQEDEKNNDKTDKEEKALAFKNEYEAMNGSVNANGKEHRTITISKDNKFFEISPEELVKKIENEETFYVYFGSKLCPWCRSVLEMADKISRDKDIDIIYYVDIWDDEGNEILRDKYILNDNNELELSIEGTDSYKKLLEYFSDFLEDYTLKDSKGKTVQVGEKRIYAPNFMYVSKGKTVRLITGISSQQTDSRGELTEEILKDEENEFDQFFLTTCDDKC